MQKHKKKTRYERGNTPSGLVARPAVPKLKHKTIFEWAENTDKKKKLEIEVGTFVVISLPFRRAFVLVEVGM